MKRKKDALKRTVVHEMGHALRSAIAEQNGMEIGQFGTATYARFEESFMMAIEQCLVGEYDPKRGLNHYLATGLSVTEKMPKEDIADILNEANFLSVINKKTPEAAQAEANRLTGIMINRTFVGMTDVDDGIAHRKDIDYYHGLADSWKLLNFAVEHDIVEETMNWVLSAKFNPFNADDRAYVNQYVTMPRELEQLFAK